MAYFFARKNKRVSRTSKKLPIFLLVFVLLFFLFAPLKPARAQLAVTGFISDIGDTLVNTAKYIYDKTSSVVDFLWQKGGSIAFQRTLSSALNTIAYDAANYLGSGGEGQSPLFYKKNLGQILGQVGDEAAGTFIETFVNNLNNPEQNTTCQKELDACYAQCGNNFKEELNGIENSRTNLDSGLESWEADQLAQGDSSIANSSYFDCNTQCAKNTTACASKNANSSNAGNVRLLLMSAVLRL